MRGLCCLRTTNRKTDVYLFQTREILKHRFWKEDGSWKLGYGAKKTEYFQLTPNSHLLTSSFPFRYHNSGLDSTALFPQVVMVLSQILYHFLGVLSRYVCKKIAHLSDFSKTARVCSAAFFQENSLFRSSPAFFNCSCNGFDPTSPFRASAMSWILNGST